MKNKQPKKAALYCRLSVDDGRMGESVSIGSQKLLLEQYMDYRKHGQIEWTPAAIIFGCLIFSLTAPLYIWTVVNI